MTTLTNEQREALVAAMDALLDKRRDSLTERARRGYGDQWLTLHHFLEATTIKDAPVEDAPALWRDSEDWMRDGSIHLELVDAPYVAAGITPEWIESGWCVVVEDADDMVAVEPKHLPALIAMLTEVQRRIGGDSC